MKWLSNLVFPQYIVGDDRNSDCLSINFLAVHCTLLNNSYLGIYLKKQQQQQSKYANKTKQSKNETKERQKEKGRAPSRIRSRHYRLLVTSRYLMPLPFKIPSANAAQSFSSH